MKKLGFVYWATAVGLCVAGVAAAGAGLLIAGDKTTGESFTKTFDEADSLEINIENCILDLKVSDTENKFKVEFENVEGDPQASMNGGKLTVSNSGNKRFVNFDIGRNKGKVTVTVPDQELKNVKLDLDAVSSGKVSDITADMLVLDFDAAAVELRNVSVLKESSVIELDASDMKAYDCIFAEGAKLDVDAFNAEMNNVVFGSVFDIDADAGIGKFSSCSFSDMRIESDASHLGFDKTVLEGNVRVNIEAGDADINIAGDSKDYNVVSYKESSDFKVNGTKGNMMNEGAKHTIEIDCTASDVNVSFK